MNTKKSIDALNSFIDINNNRFESYLTASIETKDMDLIMLFVNFQEKTKKCKAELVSEVQKLGGKPKKDSIIMKPISRIWNKIKSKFNTNDREDILNRCEYDADITFNKFKKVLSNNIEHLTQKHQYILKAHHQCIKKDHDTLKGLGDLLVICRKFNLET
jgi:uncharacterized protein (TIGR02284 family)